MPVWSPNEGHPIKKPTGFISDSIEIRKALSKTCKGKQGHCSRAEGGDHILCNGRVARLAAIFPVNLCKAILSGFSNQLRRDGVTSPGVISMHDADHGRNNETNMDDGSTMLLQQDEKYCATLNGQLLRCNDGKGPFYDDLTKQQMPTRLVCMDTSSEITRLL